MEACDCCGKRVDERSMEYIEAPAPLLGAGKSFFVCQACRGMYEDQELLEKCQEQVNQSGNKKPSLT